MKKLCLITLFLAGLASVSAAQKTGQALVDSLVSAASVAKEDTFKVKLLLDASFYSGNLNPDNAIAYGQQALSLSQKLKFSFGIATGYRYSGIGYGNKSMFPEALASFQQALKIYESYNGLSGISAVKLSMGVMYTSLKDIPNAIRYIQEALEGFRKLGKESNVSRALNNLGNAYTQNKDYANAKACYTESLAIKEKLGDVVGMESTLTNLGNVVFWQRDTVAAIEYYKQAIEINRETEDTHYQAVQLSSLGNIYHAIATDSHEGLLRKYFGGSRQMALLEARKNLEQGVKLYEELGNLSDLTDYYKLLSEVQEDLGDTRGALLNYKNYIASRDSFNNEANTRKILELEYQYDFEKKEAVNQKALLRQKLLSNAFIIGFGVMLLFTFVFFMQRNRIRKAKKKSDELLLNILPAEVAEELKEKGTTEARLYEHVSILFTDFKRFTELSSHMTPQELVAELDYCFRKFDEIATAYGIEKIKTSGDAYMAVSGLPKADPDHASRLVRAALEIRDFMLAYQAERKAQHKVFFEARIGIHSGPVVAGIVGSKKFAFDVWGDAVNTASRMESSGEPGKVNVSEATYQLLPQEAFICTFRGEIEARGKGKVNMYFVERVG